MQRLEAAIIRTLLYADIFNCALTLPELHHYLLHDAPVTLAQLEEVICASGDLQQAVCHRAGYYALAERPELIARSAQQHALAATLLPAAHHYAGWLARLPFVRMVALTGALAACNPAHPNDDYDYLIVTQPGRVWLARAGAVLLVRLAKRRGVTLCPNFVLSQDALAQTKCDVFIAHEIAQMLPLYGVAVYADLRAANPWTAQLLPNALGAFKAPSPINVQGGWDWLKRGLEVVLGGWLGDRVEAWEYQRKRRRFARQLQTPGSSAKIDAMQVKGHFNDHGHPVVRRYHERIARYGLSLERNDTSETFALAGD
ncbi:MAG: hypothetical protein H7Y11_03930 [Armatimonadetes bacterium]|nr:hypothetical protein [Anaerolineae bacterium]